MFHLKTLFWPKNEGYKTPPKSEQDHRLIRFSMMNASKPEQSRSTAKVDALTSAVGEIQVNNLEGTVEFQVETTRLGESLQKSVEDDCKLNALRHEELLENQDEINELILANSGVRFIHNPEMIPEVVLVEINIAKYPDAPNFVVICGLPAHRRRRILEAKFEYKEENIVISVPYAVNIWNEARDELLENKSIDKHYSKESGAHFDFDLARGHKMSEVYAALRKAIEKKNAFPQPTPVPEDE